jgi:hypothetical protein
LGKNKGGNKVKKFFGGAILLTFVSIFPAMTIAGVDINIGISLPLPPPIVFHAPPAVIVIPGTYVYVAPNVDVDIFFNSLQSPSSKLEELAKSGALGKARNLGCAEL